MYQNFRSFSALAILLATLIGGCIDIAFETNVKPSSKADVLTVPPDNTFTPNEFPTSGITLMDVNFDDKKYPGFFFESGDWKLVIDETGTNTVLSVTNNTGSDYVPAQVGIGLESWKDYSVEYKFRVIADSQSAPPVSLFFRKSKVGSVEQYYVLSFTQYDEIYLGYRIQGSPWRKLDLKGFTPLVDVWYSLRVEVNGEKVVVFVDDFPIFNIMDSQFDHGNLMLSVGPGTSAQFDDFRVVALGPSE